MEELKASFGGSTLKASFQQLPTSMYPTTDGSEFIEDSIELELDDIVSASALRAADRNSKIHKKLQMDRIFFHSLNKNMSTNLYSILRYRVLSNDECQLFQALSSVHKYSAVLKKSINQLVFQF